MTLSLRLAGTLLSSFLLLPFSQLGARNMELNPEACYRRSGMPIETLAIVRPPTTGDQELARRLLTGCKDASPSVAVYSSRELCALTVEALRRITLLVVSPGQCVKTSGDQEAFLSSAASAQKRILVSVGPVESPWYRRRLKSSIHFDAVFDVGFASQKDKHSEASDVPYHFVFNGLTRGEEPFVTTSAQSEVRPIPWALVGPRNRRHLDLLAELFEHRVDPEGFCFLYRHLTSKRTAQPMLSSSGLSAVLSKARYSLWASDRDVAYYESFRFIRALLAGAVPCKIDSTYPREGLDIPGVYPSVPSLQAEVQDEGFSAMYRRAGNFFVSRGPLAEHLSEALRLV